MNKNNNDHELSYNEAKALIAKEYADKQQQKNWSQNNLKNTNVEFSEELAKKNNSNKQQREK